MHSRRVIGFALALAVLVGQTIVPLARAACAGSPSKAPACPSCAAEPAPTGLTFEADRSCCAAASSLSDREPATISSDRAGDHGMDRALLAAAPSAPIPAGLLRPIPAYPTESPGSSPPLLRTTILLI